MITEDTERFFGRRIKIIKVAENNINYTGLTGRVLAVKEDSLGETLLIGTWGRAPLYPERDKIEILPRED